MGTNKKNEKSMWGIGVGDETNITLWRNRKEREAGKS